MQASRCGHPLCFHTNTPCSCYPAPATLPSQMGDRNLTVRRAAEGKGGAAAPAPAPMAAAPMNLAAMAYGANAARVVKLTHAGAHEGPWRCLQGALCKRERSFAESRRVFATPRGAETRKRLRFGWPEGPLVPPPPPPVVPQSRWRSCRTTRSTTTSWTT